MTMTSSRSGRPMPLGTTTPPADLVSDPVLRDALLAHERVRREIIRLNSDVKQAEAAARLAERDELRARANAAVQGVDDPGAARTAEAREQLARLEDKRRVAAEAMVQVEKQLHRAIRERGHIEAERIAQEIDAMRTAWLGAVDDVDELYGQLRQLGATKAFFEQGGARGYKTPLLGAGGRSVDDILNDLRGMIPPADELLPTQPDPDETEEATG
jgi:hypothetical protein